MTVLSTLSLPHVRQLAAELLLTTILAFDPALCECERYYALEGNARALSKLQPVVSACQLSIDDFVTTADPILRVKSRTSRPWTDLQAAAQEAAQQMRELFPPSGHSDREVAVLMAVFDWAAPWEEPPGIC